MPRIIQTPATKNPDSSLAGQAQPPAADSFTRLCVEAAVRALLLVAVLALVLTLLGLSACGPGTGGTGVGPVTGLSPVSIAYSGTTTAAPAPAATPAAPAPVTTVVGCTAHCTGTLTLQLEADRVVLQGGCFGFTSQAPLVVAASGPTVLAGTYQRFGTAGGQATTSSVPANLFLQFANGQSDSTSVSLSVRNTAGTLLVGPVTLLRAALASAPLPGGSSPVSACP